MALTGPGLCGRCRWVRRVRTVRGSGFLRCTRSETDGRFPKYPRLPVVRCDGYEASGDGGAAADGALEETRASEKKES